MRRLVLIGFFGIAFSIFLGFEASMLSVKAEILLVFFLLTPILVILAGVMSLRYRRTGISFFLILLGAVYAGYLMPGGIRWDLGLIDRIQHGILLLLPILFLFFSFSPDRGFLSVSGLGGIGLLVLGGIGIRYLSVGEAAPGLVGRLRSLGMSGSFAPQDFFFYSWNLSFLQSLVIISGFVILLFAALVKRRNSGWLAPWPVILLSFVAGISRMSMVPILLYWVLVGVGFVLVILLHEAWREAYFDPVTGVGNLKALRFLLGRRPDRFSQGIVTLEDFDAFCTTYGEEAGVQYLRMAASFVSAFRPAFLVYRLDGPRFALLRKVGDSENLAKIEEELQNITQSFQNRGFKLRKSRVRVEVRLGIEWGTELYLK